MTKIDVHARPTGAAMSGARLCASIGLFILCNVAGAAVVPLLAMASA